MDKETKDYLEKLTKAVKKNTEHINKLIDGVKGILEVLETLNER